MILATSILLLAVTAVNSQIPGRYYRPRSNDEASKPYAFSYKTVLDDNVFRTGQISRQETADGNGGVQEFYSSENAKGHNRILDYVANHDGFRPHIRTMEAGTGNQNSADVIMESSNLSAKRNYRHTVHTRRPAAPTKRRPAAPTKRRPAAPTKRRTVAPAKSRTVAPAKRRTVAPRVVQVAARSRPEEPAMKSPVNPNIAPVGRRLVRPPPSSGISN